MDFTLIIGLLLFVGMIWVWWIVVLLEEFGKKGWLAVFLRNPWPPIFKDFKG